jgi:Oxidoreductase family, NAD-binding Rossmann fold
MSPLSTPRHLPDALGAIEAGKHVLVEKPLALNASEARQLKEAARRKGVFLMEAFWTAFLPKFDIIRQLLADGALGSVRTVIADHGEWFPPEHRIMRSELVGGPMLDLGIYPVAFATLVLGRPDRVMAIGEDAPSGVNGQLQSCFLIQAGRSPSCTPQYSAVRQETPLSPVRMECSPFLAAFIRRALFTVTANDLTTRLIFDEPRNQYKRSIWLRMSRTIDWSHQFERSRTA